MIKIFFQDLKKVPRLVLKFLKCLVRAMVKYLGGPICINNQDNIAALMFFESFFTTVGFLVMPTEPSGYWLLSILTLTLLIRLIEYYVRTVLNRRAKIKAVLTGLGRAQSLPDIWSSVEIIESKEKPRQLPNIWEAKIV